MLTGRGAAEAVSQSRSEGSTYVSAKDGSSVRIRGGGNRSNNQIEVPDSNYIEMNTPQLRLTGGLYSGTTIVLDSSRNLTNIGTITSGAITSSGNIAISAGNKIQLSGSADQTHHIYHNSSTDYDTVNYSTGFKLEHYQNGTQFTMDGATGNTTFTGGITTSGVIEQTANEGREIRTYMPSSYTTNDIVSGHEYGWYSDYWRIGISRSGNTGGEAFRFNYSGSYVAQIGTTGIFDGAGYCVNGTTIVDSSRNLTNIATISSGAITVNNQATGDQRHLFIDGYNAEYDFRSNSTSNYRTTFNMNNNGLQIGHDSSSRSFALRTAGTDRLTISGAGTFTFNNNNLQSIGTISSGAITSTEFINDTHVSNATTPANTAGWFKIAKVVRGSGRILLSFIGGNYTPDTYVIDYYRNWSTAGSLFLKKLQSTSFITKAKIRQDSSDSNYYVEIYCASNSNGLNFEVYHQRLQGYANTGNEVYGGSLSAGSTSGTDIVSEQSFVSKGIWTEAIEADYYYGNVNILTGALKINSTTVVDSSRNLTNIGTMTSGS